MVNDCASIRMSYGKIYQKKLLARVHGRPRLANALQRSMRWLWLCSSAAAAGCCCCCHGAGGGRASKCVLGPHQTFFAWLLAGQASNSKTALKPAGHSVFVCPPFVPPNSSKKTPTFCRTHHHRTTCPLPAGNQPQCRQTTLVFVDGREQNRKLTT